MKNWFQSLQIAASFFINQNKLANGYFKWQQSASAFSVSKKDVDGVCKYILNQAEHHRKTTYAQEYDRFLKHYQQTIKNKV
jgi:putative transposase